MRYFTRDRLQRVQDDIGAQETDAQREVRVETAIKDWDQANDAYLDYLAEVRQSITPDVAELTETTFHDAVCESISHADGIVEILLDTRHALVTTRGHATIRFCGVKRADGLESAVGQWLLYEEVEVLASGYEFRALLERSEILIQFDAVAIAYRPER